MNSIAELAVSSLLAVVSILASIFFAIYGLAKTTGTAWDRRSYRPFLTIIAFLLLLFTAQAITGWFAVAGCAACEAVVRQTVPWSIGIMALVVAVLAIREWTR